MPPAIAIILNGISRKKKKFYGNVYPLLAQKFVVKIVETQYAGHAFELAAQSVRQGFEFIVAAGGDGTLHQVINGVHSVEATLPVAVGVIPLGTGNDFARTCGISSDPNLLLRLLEANRPRSVDLGKLTCHDPQGRKVIRYFINACSVGMGPVVVQRLAKNSRLLGPVLTYWKAITTTFFTHRPQVIRCKAPLLEWEGKTRVLAVANGRSFGNSLYIAPDASVDDGMLNLFIAGDVPLLKFLQYQQALKSIKKIHDTRITYHQSTRIELGSTEPCAIEAEGELAGFLPAEIEVIPAAIRFLR